MNYYKVWLFIIFQVHIYLILFLVYYMYNYSLYMDFKHVGDQTNKLLTLVQSNHLTSGTKYNSL